MKGNIVIFEDHRLGRMRPVTLTRPAFAVTCGGWTLREVACLAHCRVRHIVREHVREVCRRDCPDSPRGNGPTLFLNASLVPDVGYVRAIRELLLEDTPRLYTCGNRVAAALVPSDRDVPRDLTSGNVSGKLQKHNLPEATDVEFRTIDYPHELIRINKELFPDNIRRSVVQSDYPEIQPGVFAAPGAQVADSAVFRTENGPVLLDEGVRVMDFAYFEGPACVGPGSVIMERASIKNCVSVGHTCKIGGEVEASVIEPYSNKQHHGFLGHSWVGSWVNLGAGTSNSDLTTTYEKAEVRHQGECIEPETLLMGCLIGDYSRSAVNTSILTGKIIGVSTMLYGHVAQNVPSFSDYARCMERVNEYPLEQAIATQKRMFQRRDVDQTPADAELLRAVYDLTRREREFSEGGPTG